MSKLLETRFGKAAGFVGVLVFILLASVVMGQNFDPNGDPYVGLRAALPTGANTIGAVTANAGTNLNTSALALDATVTNRLPAGSTPADNESNAITTSRIGTFNWIFDGSTWDRWTGAVTAPTLVQEGTYTGRTPAGASPADNESNTNTALSRIGGYQFLYDGSTWDRWPGDSTNGGKVNLQAVAGTTVATGGGVSNAGTARVVQAQEATYSAGTTIRTAVAASASPFFSLCGSATKTVRVQRFVMSGTSAAVAYVDPVFKRTSSATSGGTATTLTVLPFDSNNAAGTAVAKIYTAAPTAGTSVGVIATFTAHFPATGTVTAGSTPPIVWMWRDTDSEAPTLRGTAQCFEANYGTVPGITTITLSVVWTEQ